ncbi:hypothetical protein ANTHELSMS3_00222 [Antarctobacter heliothermus]|uniref:Uncharacterized protein n=1 Tax=Antarctobacter heliothermus TaxID=74033 RepID=A0A222DYB0_9RHOB|nr:hypothetical protein [Antarctobacter heliothermus]ASP18947.1 hypothetical protein ANTHELSMS3_00222 [Antarctobacter heliothermus]
MADDTDGQLALFYVNDALTGFAFARGYATRWQIYEGCQCSIVTGRRKAGYLNANVGFQEAASQRRSYE